MTDRDRPVVAGLFSLNEGLLILRTLTFQHFSPHKAPGCTKPHVDCESRARRELFTGVSTPPC